MGKLYLALEEDLNLLDLMRALVAQALEILLHNPKTKAEYAKSFESTLKVVQNMQILLNCSQTKDGNPKEKEAEKERKTECSTAQKAGNSGNILTAPPDKNQQEQRQSTVKIPENSVKIGQVQKICPSTFSEPVRKVAKTTEVPKLGYCFKTTTVLKNPVDGRTPAQKALTNSLIVQKIMQNATSKTLKSCRSLCKLWEEEATKHLLTSRHNQFHEVKFRWSENNGEYKHSCLGALQTFIDFCFKKSRLFPCVQFNFTGGYLHSPAFLNFFKDFGTIVKFLRLNPCTNNKDESSLAVQSLGGVLFKLAPNLEGLTLDSIDWTRGQDFPKNVSDPAPVAPRNRKKRGGRRKSTKNQKKGPQTIPNLKKVVLPLQRNRFPINDSEMNRLVLTLLRVAGSNLHQIEDKNLFFTREIVAAGKFSLIKSLYFDCYFQPYEVRNRYLYFSEQNSQLEFIKLMWVTGDDMQNCVAAILTSSKTTLITLYGLENIDFTKCQFSPLENVRAIYLKPSNYLSNGAVVPRAQGLNNFLPNLKRIGCDPKILESPANASKRVDSLFLTSPPSSKLISNAESVYPNLKMISLTFNSNDAGKLPEAIKAICLSFPLLETLRIHINVSWFGWDFCGEIDSAFTGLSLSQCKEIARTGSTRQDDKTLKILEANGQPSIRDLTNLKQLEICVEQHDLLKMQTRRICTRVSDLYAFDLMKQRQGLKVREVVRN